MIIYQQVFYISEHIFISVRTFFDTFFHLTKDLYDNRCMHDYILIFSVGLFYYKDGYVGFKNSRLRHMESRRSNLEPGDQEDMCSYDSSTILSF